jgi:fibronectin type 3 domain-containing protein
MMKARHKHWILGLVVVTTMVFVSVGTSATLVAPANTTPPTISGTTMVGQTLTANTGTWSNTPVSYAYQWLRCNGGGNACSNIAAATTNTYVVAAADSGKTLRVHVTATNADGSTSAESAETGQVSAATSNAAPGNTTPPTISGTPKVGLVLTANDGSWSGNPTSFTYVWKRCEADTAACANVVGATGKTYGVRIGDLGYRLRVTVTAKNAKGTGTANSAITKIVQPAVRITNGRPTIKIVSIRFSGPTVYARFRICDDSYKNLTILATDSRPGVASYTRRFTTLVAPKPCGVYTRHWTPVARFRGHGTYTVTLKARDKSGLTSLPAKRTFSR